MDRCWYCLGVAILLLGFNLPLTGCAASQGQALVPTYKVSGKLTHKGEPMSGAIVIFFPVSEGLVVGTGYPRGTADEQGNYQLTTFVAGDGAPPGEYRVTVYWPEPGPEDADPLPPDRLKNAYSDERKTKLVATVGEQDSTIHFELPK